MAVTNRSAEILRLVELHGSYRIADLAHDLDVSDETIRRNIRPLVDKGMVLKVHGGIMLPDRMGEPPFQNRMQEHPAAKQAIAAMAARQIHNGDSLILDGGATTTYVGLALTGHRDLQVVTNSTDIGRTLSPRGNNRVYMAGGELRADDGAAFGIETCEFIKRFHVRQAVLSVAAVNAWGFTNQHPCESDFARAAIQQAERVIVVADNSKFGRDGFVKVCGIAEIDMLITDVAPPHSIVKQLREADVDVLVAAEDEGAAAASG